jgi:hypothetical protein
MTVFVLDNGHESPFNINVFAPVVDFSIEVVVAVYLIDDTIFDELTEVSVLAVII